MIRADFPETAVKSEILMGTPTLESIETGPSPREILPNAQTIGAIAGAVWRHLQSNGKTSVIRLKSEIQCSATALHLALGWLLREDKVEFLNEKGHLMARLKE